MKGISVKLVFILLLCTLVVLGLLGALEFHAGSMRIEQQVNQAMSDIGKRLSHGLRHPVYDLDRAAINDALLGEFSNKELRSVIVWFQGRKEMLTGLGRHPDGSVLTLVDVPSEKDLIHGFWPISRPSKSSSEASQVVGEIEVVVDNTFLVRELQRELFNNFTKVLLTVGLLLLVLTEIIRRSLVQPLEHLRQSMLVAEHSIEADIVEDDEVDRLLQLPAPIAKMAFDEIRGMSKTFNNLVQSAWQRQSALRQSEERYRELVEESQALIIKMDTSFVCMYANPAVEKITRLTPSQIIGQKVIDFIHPADIRKARAILTRFTLGHFDNVNVENRIIGADGHVTHMAWTISIAYDYSGAPIYYRAIGRDVTAERMTERKLKESEARYRRLSQEFAAVLDGIVDSLVLLAPDLKIVWGNQGAARQLKLPPDEIIGKSCRQFWACDDAKPCDDCVQSVFQSGKPIEYMRTAADGSVWGVKGYPVFDNEGEVVNVIQIASDLSEKMQLRKEVARAAHLAALGGLSAGIAHEINNPTGLVLMALPFVKDAMQDLLPLTDDYVEQNPGLQIAGLPYDTFREEILQTIEDMQGGAQRVKRIVEDLKDFSREEFCDEGEDIDLNKMVEQGLRLLQNIIKNRTDRFILEVEENLPKVKGFSQRLEQVLVNLVQNACQALDSREESVTLKIYFDDVRQKILLQVSDEGCGMPENLLGKITDPFFTTRREEGGTGLGLSVSTRIIEEHNGIMKVNSEPGKGSVFTVELPIANGEHS